MTSHLLGPDDPLEREIRRRKLLQELLMSGQAPEGPGLDEGDQEDLRRMQLLQGLEDPRRDPSNISPGGGGFAGLGPIPRQQGPGLGQQFRRGAELGTGSAGDFAKGIGDFGQRLARGAVAVPGLIDKAVPDVATGALGIVNSVAKLLDQKVAGPQRKALDFVREQTERLPSAPGLLGAGSRLAGNLVGEIGAIALTPGLSLGRTAGTRLLSRAVTKSLPSTTIQSAGGEEGSLVAQLPALAELSGKDLGRAGPVIEAIASNPALRIPADIAIDVLLGLGIEGGLRGVPAGLNALSKRTSQLRLNRIADLKPEGALSRGIPQRAVSPRAVKRSFARLGEAEARAGRPVRADAGDVGRQVEIPVGQPSKDESLFARVIEEVNAAAAGRAAPDLAGEAGFAVGRGGRIRPLHDAEVPVREVDDVIQIEKGIVARVTRTNPPLAFPPRGNPRSIVYREYNVRTDDGNVVRIAAGGGPGTPLVIDGIFSDAGVGGLGFVRMKRILSWLTDEFPGSAPIRAERISGARFGPASKPSSLIARAALEDTGEAGQLAPRRIGETFGERGAIRSDLLQSLGGAAGGAALGAGVASPENRLPGALFGGAAGFIAAGGAGNVTRASRRAVSETARGLSLAERRAVLANTLSAGAGAGAGAAIAPEGSRGEGAILGGALGATGALLGRNLVRDELQRARLFPGLRRSAESRAAKVRPRAEDVDIGPQRGLITPSEGKSELLVKGIDRLDDARQTNLSRQVTKTVTADVNKISGTAPVRQTESLGQFDGITPNSVAEFADDVADEAISRWTAVDALSRGQEAGIWLREVPEGTTGEFVGPGYVTHLGNQAEDVYAKLGRIIADSEEFAPLNGSTLMPDGGVVFRNFGETAEAEYRQLLDAALSKAGRKGEFVTEATFDGRYLSGSDLEKAAGGRAANQALRVLRTKTSGALRSVNRRLGNTPAEFEGRLSKYIAEHSTGAPGVTRRATQRVRSLGETGTAVAGGRAVSPTRITRETLRQLAGSRRGSVVGAEVLHRANGTLTDAQLAARLKSLGVRSDAVAVRASRKQYQNFVTKALRNGTEMPSARTLNKAALEGSGGADWYKDFLPQAERVFGNREDAEMFTRFFAVTSQMGEFAGVAGLRGGDNIDLARKAFLRWKQGLKFTDEWAIRGVNTKARPVILGNLRKVAGGHLPGGRKINNFMRALFGDEDVVVVDRWMSRLFGQGDSPKDTAYDLIESMIKQEARKMGVSARQYQAALWETVRSKAGIESSLKAIEGVIERIDHAGGIPFWLRSTRGFAKVSPASFKKAAQGVPTAPRIPPGGVLTPIAGAGVGSVVGAAVAPEGQRGKGAAIGAAVGAGAAVVGAKVLAKGASRLARTATPLPRTATVTTPSSLPPSQIKKLKGTLKPQGSEVQLNKFGLEAAGLKKIEAAKASLESTEIPAVRVSNAETAKQARKLGMQDITEADVNGNLDGTTMLAMRQVYAGNEKALNKLYAQLRDAPVDKKGPIQNAIDSLDAQNRALVKAFIPRASEFGRNLQSLQIAAKARFKNTPEALFFWEQQGARAAGRDLLDTEVAEIRRLLAMGPQGRSKLIKFMQELNPPLTFRNDAFAILNQIRRAGLLTGIRTQARNFLSNTSEAVMRQADDAPAIIMDRLIEKGLIPGVVASGRRSRVALSVGQRIKAGKLGAQKAFGRNGTIARTFRGELDAGELRKLDISASLNIDNRFIDGYTKFMFRLQGAADQPARQFAFMESLLSQFKLVARERGIPKGQVDEWIERQLKGSLKKTDETGVPDEFVLQAIIDSEEAVFQNRSVVGTGLRNAIGGLRRLEAATANPVTSFAAKQAVNIVEFVIPFRSTPSAVFGRLVERTPVGFLGGFAGLVRLNKALKAGADPVVLQQMQRQVTKTVGRATTGSVALAFGAMLAHKKLASGRWPDDQKEANRWLADGKSEDAILLNGRWRKLTGVSPIGNLVALGAQFYHDANNPEYRTGSTISSATSVAQAEALGLARTFLEQSFLRGVKDLLKGFESRRGGKRQQEKFSASLGRSFVPIIVGDLAKALDPVQRDPRTVWQGAKVNIPGLSRTVAFRPDELGRPKTLQIGSERASRFFDPFVSQTPRSERDPFLKEFKRVGFVPSRLSKQKGESDENYRARQQRVGAESQKALQIAFANPRYRRLDIDTQAEALQRIISGVRRATTQADKPRGRRLPTTWRSLVNRQITSAARP